MGLLTCVCMERWKMEATVAANMRKRKQALVGQAFSLAGIRVLPYPGNRLLLVLGSSYQGI